MNWFRRLRVVTSKDRTTVELDEELQFHLDRLAEQNIAAGMSPEEARSAAQREFGGTAFLKDECRSSRGVDWVENLGQDLRYALRNFRRRPGFAVAVVALMAVGTGAATAVFSVVDRVLFRGLPYANAAQLVSAGMRIPWLDYDFLTPFIYDQMQRDPKLFAASTSWSGISDCDINEDRPERLGCALVESTFLPVLGIQPALGRNFTAEEDLPDVPAVALISRRLWKSRFGGDPGAVGRRLTVDGRQVRIIGVLPADFELPTLDRADLVMPQGLPRPIPASTAANSRPIRVYARLRPGLSAERAREHIEHRNEFFADIPPDVRQHIQFRVRSLRDLSTGSFRAASWVLLAAVLAMLLIACANAANLLLARSAAMRRELAIRVALGAGRGRMIRQSLTESLLLASAGGIAGCGLAYGLLRVFILIAPEGIPHLSTASLDLRVLLFGIAASLASGAACGLAPALHTPGPAMLTGVRATGSTTLFARRVLVTAQIVASVVLLTCAGMLLQSFWNQQGVALGMRTERVLTAQIVPGARYEAPALRRELYEKLEARMKGVPGIEAVALSDSLPPAGVPRSVPLFLPQVDGKPPLDDRTPGIVVWRAVSPAYFRTLGIPIIRGRAFNDDDRRPDQGSVILSASFAKFLFGDENPVGRRMCLGRGCREWDTIVGVAGDARNAGLSDRNNAEFYACRRAGQTDYRDAPPVSALIVRAHGRADALSALLRNEIAAIDPALPVTIQTFAEHMGELAARPRFEAWLLALFAGIGLLIAALGLYGLVHFLVVQRERELGIRLTLGASPPVLVRMILGDAVRWTAAGLVIGVAGAAAAAQSLRGLLFHVSPADPRAYGGAALLLTAVALLAALLPSLRAARLDPASTLRQD